MWFKSPITRNKSLKRTNISSNEQFKWNNELEWNWMWFKSPITRNKSLKRIKS